MCMRVEFHHTKNGFPSAWALSMKASASAVTSSSTVSMRFRVSGPVSSICLRAVGHWPTSGSPRAGRTSP